METDLVLSSVHIGTDSQASIGQVCRLCRKNSPYSSSQSTVISKFRYSVSRGENQGSTGVEASSKSVLVDEDGDLDVPRREHKIRDKIITLCHTMATPLNSVGTQLWSASLLMADYIISNEEMFCDAIVVELGSGCGFLGIVAAPFVRHFFCTDTGTAVLELCHQNLVQNNATGNVSVHELNWFNSEKELHSLSSCSSSNCSGRDDDHERYKWRHNELELLKKASIILASDVIYDNELTDALISTIVYLSSNIMETPPLIIIGMEKRINFTLADLAPSSPCYEHFLSCLMGSHYEAQDGTKVAFDASPLATDFLQSFSYERVKELEIWKLKAQRIL